MIAEDFALANTLLASIAVAHYDELARFLQKQGFVDEALQLAQDPELRFDLALESQNIEVALHRLPHA